MKIVFLHESGGGVVKEILNNGRISILDEEGFSNDYLASQIAPVYKEHYPVDDNVVSNIHFQDSDIKTKSTRKASSVESGKLKITEIDLHIEELTDSHKGLSNHEILSRQMIAFRQFYSRARVNKTRKIVIIHGVGEGVLRYEIRSFLNKENGVDFYDASYLDYGQGATVVELF